MFSARAQSNVCISIFLSGVALYIFYYFQLSSSNHHLPLSSGSVGITLDGRQDFTVRLSPSEHFHRAPKSLHLKWNITSDLRAPDGVLKRVYLINGKFPGPVIEARSGDELNIEVYNGLSDNESTAIHWHGLSMRGANQMDGVVGLTQASILASENFTYKFTIDGGQSGTFWYHAHSDVQRADGLYGPLIIHSPAEDGVSAMEKYNYDEDQVLMVGDWYHQSADDVLAFYTDYRNFTIEPTPDSMLLNGIGSFNCSMAVPAHPLHCTSTFAPILRIRQPRMRLRLINTGATSGLTISMAGYNMLPIAADGGDEISSNMWSSSMGVLYPGERIDIIIEVSKNSSKNPSLTIALDQESLKFKNFALTPSQHFAIVTTEDRKNLPNIAHKDVMPFSSISKLPGPPIKDIGGPMTSENIILLYTKIAVLSEYHNSPKGFINRTFWDLPAPASRFPLIDQDLKEWEGQHFIPHISSGHERWVDIVLNNMDDRGHPFHLHGNSFYVLSTHQARIGSYDAFNPFEPAKEPAGGPINLQNPIRKDTVYVPAMGYVVLRFKADNPGLWLFHCHVLWHHAVGMAMAIHIS